MMIFVDVHGEMGAMYYCMYDYICLSVLLGNRGPCGAIVCIDIETLGSILQTVQAWSQGKGRRQVLASYG
jgi:hypothetical protein